MKISQKKQLEIYQSMFKIRRVEERLNELFAKNLLPGWFHSSLGQEACAVGVCAALRTDDYILSNHRGKGHFLAKGMAIKPMMAEMLAKRTGICKGKGGEMHAADPSLGILAGNGIVGGGIPTSTGVGLSAIIRGTDQVVAVFFGEGAANTGGFHEALNLASVWNLPVLFVCENNLYAEMTPSIDVSSNINIGERGKTYNIPGRIVDGCDVMAVYGETQKAVARARKGKGPTLLELKTYRWEGHFQGDPRKYRTREEEQEWKDRCPVKGFREYLLKSDFSEGKITKLEKSVNEEVEEAIEFAFDSDHPEPEEALKFVYAE